MARKSITLAQICAADIIADTQAIADGDYELFDAYPSELGKLEDAIAEAVTALLPDELIVREGTRTDPDGGGETRVWFVLQGLDPATTNVYGRGLQDASTPVHLDAISWLEAPSVVAERINLDTLVTDAVRNARNALEADL